MLRKATNHYSKLGKESNTLTYFRVRLRAAVDIRNEFEEKMHCVKFDEICEI